jgi:hypothetical protein
MKRTKSPALPEPEYPSEALKAWDRLNGPGDEAPVETAPRSAGSEGKPRAIFVIHGMGQQLPFETLDAVASRLYAQDVRVHGPSGAWEPQAGTANIDGQAVRRVEMTLRDENKTRRTVHLYEAYWSPLTEGVVTLRDVARFLLLAGLNGLKNGQRFSRRIFHIPRTFYASVRTLIYLIAALGVVVSLGIIGTAAAVIPAARSPFTEPPAWLSDELFSDLTGLFNALVRVLAPFVVAISLSLLLSYWRPQSNVLRPIRDVLALVLGGISLACFIAAIFGVLAAGIGVPLLIALHKTKETANYEFLPTVVRTISEMNLDLASVPLLMWIASGIILLLLIARRVIRWVVAAVAFVVRALGSSLSLAVIAVFFGVVYGLWLFVAQFDVSLLLGVSSDGFVSASVWAALIVASLVTRRFLVQYLGDVVAYLESHKVDRFYDLRERIRKLALDRLRDIYAHRSVTDELVYDSVYIVGHSLGSVIAYDTLNALIAADEVSEWQQRIAPRTKLLLTFGSPLDKTAYIFATQAKKWSTTYVRDKLAAAAQPLISLQTERQQIKWINIYSPWDLISGPLEFYDPEEPQVAADGFRKVLNERDTQAVTLLGAHTEYWRNWLVYQRLWEAVVDHPKMAVAS